MSRYGITYEQVMAVADELLRQKQNPTIELVRRQLGAGSNTTLSKHLNAWRTQRMLHVVEEAPEKILPPDEVSRAVENVWERLNTQAYQQTEKIKKECEEKVAAATQAMQQLQQEKAELLEALTKAQTRINHYEADITLLKKELLETRHQQELAEERAQSSQEVLETVQKESTLYLEKLEKNYSESLQNLKQQAETQQNNYEKIQSDWKNIVESQRTAFMVELDKLKTINTKLDQQVIKHETELKQRGQQIERLEENIRALQFDLTMALQRQQDAEKVLTAQQIENNLKEKSLSEWQQKFEAAKEETGVLKQQINLLQEKFNQLSQPSTERE